MNTAISKAPDKVKEAFERLKEEIFDLDGKPDHMTLLMAVNIDNARATLIPIATPENMYKFNRYLKQLPKGVQKAIMENIPKETLEQSELIWNYLGTVKELHQKDEGRSLPQVLLAEENKGSGKKKKVEA